MKAFKVEKPFALQLLKGSGQFLLSSSPFLLTASDRQERVKAKPRRPREARGVSPSEPLSDPRDARSGFVVTHVQAEKRARRGWPSPGCYPTSGATKNAPSKTECQLRTEERHPYEGKRLVQVPGTAAPPWRPGARPTERLQEQQEAARSPSCCLRPPACSGRRL